MNIKEQSTVDKLSKSVEALIEENRQLKRENNEFRTELNSTVKDLSSRIEKKHLPISLELDILNSVNSSVNESIKSALTGYNSPLTKLVTIVVEEHSEELKTIISDSFTSIMNQNNFKESIKEALYHKMPKSIISANDGLLDKVTNDLKSNPVFRSKVTLAISSIIEELNKE